MKTFRGVAASPGVAIGRAFVHYQQDLAAPRRVLPKPELRREIVRFKEALEKTREELEESRKAALRRLGRKHARLFEAYILILEDPLLKDEVLGRIGREGVNAEYALHETIWDLASSFDAVEDEYLRARKEDVLEAGRKIMGHLAGTGPTSLRNIQEEMIVIAHNLAPSDTLHMRQEMVRGFATEAGGRTSHTAILAQSLEIPAVVGVRDLLSGVETGDMVIVDGREGIVIVKPEPAVLENYERERIRFAEERQELAALRNLPAVTTDGHRLEIGANIEVPSEAATAIRHGAEGIGLFRTEFLFLDRPDLPSEEEQYEAYRQVAETMLPHPVLLRTLDLGGDKLPEHTLSIQRSPFLGLRSTRLCLKFPEMFKTQLRAILRASAHGRVKMMYPLISGVEEFRQANRLLEEAKEDLRRVRIPFDENMEVGAMIELPSAALTADLLAKEANFLSIGTNDLIQYTLAVDRGNEHVSDLYDPMHLSVVRLIHRVAEAGRLAGRWVGLCGEMAADPTFVPLLVGLGLQELSVAPAAIPRVKKVVRSISMEEARALAAEVLSLTDRRELIRRLQRISP